MDAGNPAPKRPRKPPRPFEVAGKASVDSGALGVFTDLEDLPTRAGRMGVRIPASGNYIVWYRRKPKSGIVELRLKRGKKPPKSATGHATMKATTSITVVDPAYVFPRPRYEDYLEKLQRLDWGARPGLIEGMTETPFFVSATGGDGRFRVLVKRDSKGRVSQLWVPFEEDLGRSENPPVISRLAQLKQGLMER